MNFFAAAHSDIGIKRETNQDSVLVQIADTDYGEVCLSVICDGMGGYSKGELASATMIVNFKQWFEKDFPKLLYQGIKPENLKRAWEDLIFNTNNQISNYSTLHGARLGTTVAALLLVGEMYYIIHVGDSRVYLMDRNLSQLTKDQTFVQREMDAGRMTPEQALSDPQRNVLLQCVGASEVIEPDFMLGPVTSDEMFLLCTDGFRHLLTDEEIYANTNPIAVRAEEEMKKRIIYLTDLNKYRREKDNISSILVRVN